MDLVLTAMILAFIYMMIKSQEEDYDDDEDYY